MPLGLLANQEHLDQRAPLDQLAQLVSQAGKGQLVTQAPLVQVGRLERLAPLDVQEPQEIQALQDN